MVRKFVFVLFTIISFTSLFSIGDVKAQQEESNRGTIFCFCKNVGSALGSNRPYQLTCNYYYQAQRIDSILLDHFQYQSECLNALKSHLGQN